MSEASSLAPRPRQPDPTKIRVFSKPDFPATKRRLECLPDRILNMQISVILPILDAPDRVKEMHAAALPHYEHMYAHRLRVTHNEAQNG